MAPETDADHMKLIGRAMFVAANAEIFGPALALVLALLVLFLIRRRRRA